MPTPLDELSTAQINAIQTHPLHQQGFRTIITLIRQLRTCESQADLYDFQQVLLDELLTIEEHRLKCRRVVKRLERGRSVPADAVALVGTGDPQQLATWQLEHDVCVRVSRQLRCVGDALAWQAFDYQRNFVLVLSRNQPPGPMAGKAGLLAEREFLTRTWRDDGHFAIMHDLTSCLRIGDASVFMPGFVRLEEIKTNNEHHTATQKHRIRTAGEALRSAAPMPTGQVPVKIDVPYRTHLDVLREVLDLAHQRGLQRAQVPGGRALVAGNLFTAPSRWPEEEFGRRFSAAMQTAKRQARIVNGHEITLKSVDQVGRSPVAPPWAIYPLSPEMCASLIVDAAFFYVSMSSTRVLDALAGHGLRAEWLQPLDEDTDPTAPLLQIDRVISRRPGVTNVGRVSMNFVELNRLLLELVDLDTWAKHIDIMLARTDLAGVSPWPYFVDEWKVWV
ncbi:hypothetical protein [Dactylosporangium sp. CA-139066]|uniref:hypothetical protein n=1 Tax=Dactylosporangium sp. CA-139066 TaxID=3239930 RepID=UPI003D932CE2